MICREYFWFGLFHYFTIDSDEVLSLPSGAPWILNDATVDRGTLVGLGVAGRR